MISSPKTLVASKTLVKEFAEMDPAPYDRPLSERRLLVYQRILAAGEFRPVTWASAVCLETNNTYRVNGKHTSRMLSGFEKLPDFFVTVERYQCDKLTDVANLYNTFDSRLGARTTGDINLAFAATVRGLDKVPKRFIHLVVTAAAHQKWGEKARDVPPAEKAEELLDNGSFAVWLSEKVLTNSATNSRAGTYAHLVRGPVVSAMLATHTRAGPNKAAEFWVAVRDEIDPDRDAPSRTLARYLVRASLSRKGSGAERKLVDNREMHVKCLHAWNAYRKGERTALNYHAKADVPKAA